MSPTIYDILTQCGYPQASPD